MKRFEGKTVLITGGARGQGRAHAIGFAREGANVVLVDVAAPIDVLKYPLPTADDLEGAAAAVRELGVDCLAVQADVRDRAAMHEAVEEAVARFGGLDVVVANAGIFTFGPFVEMEHAEWDASIATILDGTWNTLKPAVPHMLERGAGGRIIVTGSSVVRVPHPNSVTYQAAKAGLVGFVKSLAQELVAQRITVNIVHPGMVNTPILLNEAVFKLFVPDKPNPTQEDAEAVFRMVGANGEPYLVPEDITDGVLFLASEEARNITGLALDISGGMTARQAG